LAKTSLECCTLQAAKCVVHNRHYTQ